MRKRFKYLLVEIAIAGILGLELYLYKDKDISNTRSIIITTAFFISLVLVKNIKNSFISFAAISALCVGVGIYNVEYVTCYYPLAVFVWSAYSENETKAIKLRTLLLIGALGTATYFCFQKKIVSVTRLSFCLSINIPIIVIAYILFCYFVALRSEEEKSVMPSGVKLMTLSYVWSIAFIIEMAWRYSITVIVLTAWICAMIYVINAKETMLFTAFPVLEKIYREESLENAEITDDREEKKDPNEK